MKKSLIALSLTLLCCLPFASYANNADQAQSLKNTLANHKLKSELAPFYAEADNDVKGMLTILYGVFGETTKNYTSLNVYAHDFNFYKGKVAHHKIDGIKLTVIEGHLDHAYTALKDDLVTYTVFTDGETVIVNDFQVKKGSYATALGLASSISAKGVDLNNDEAKALIADAFEARSSAGNSAWERVIISLLKETAIKAHRLRFGS